MLPSKSATTFEEALERYQQGHRDVSVEVILSVIDFDKEAEAVSKRGVLAPPDKAAFEVAATAVARKTELCDLYCKRGLKGGLNIAACEVVTKFENSPVQHTFVLRDESVKNAVNSFSLAFHKNANGWFLVRSA